MASMEVDPEKIREFADADTFYQWLSRHHDKEDELWIKIHKVGSGRKSITPKEAIDVVLCWGWIDGIRKAFDDESYLQRYTPRRKKSIWSKINVDNVARLTAEGRMTEFGLREVEAAKADGRWERAYASGKDLQIPDDLQMAIDAEPEARAAFEKLNAQNRYALAFRLHNLRTEAGRRRKIAAFVEMLKRGETFYPQREKQIPREAPMSNEPSDLEPPADLVRSLWSPDKDVQNDSFTRVMEATDEPVAWSYKVWDEVVGRLGDESNRNRAIAAQVLSNLAKSDPERRMLTDLPALVVVTRDPRFVTARHCLQSLWKVGVAGEAQRERLVEALEHRFEECADEKNATLIRYDIIVVLRRIYDEVGDESVREKALALVDSETDAKYRKKYAKVWK